MKIFLFILTNNIIPIFTLISVGYILNKNFNLHIGTLSKLIFYVFVPSFTFVNLYSAKVPAEMVKVLAAAILILVANAFIASLVAKFRGYSKGFSNAFANSIMFYNSGNIGIPLITLVFSNAPFISNGDTPYLSLALTAQVMVYVVQNITTNTIGFFNAGSAKLRWKDTLVQIFHMPTVYVIPLALIFKLIPYDFTQVPIWPSFKYAANGLIPGSLITLGAQLSRTKMEFKNKEVYLSSFMRLVIGPIMALCLIYLLKIDGIIAQVVMVSSALPTAVNSALIAIEYDNHPDFASQTVMISTILSSVSLAFVIYIARVLFPTA